MQLGSISVKLDPASVMGTGPIHIPEVRIEKPQVTFEVTNSGATNLQAIQRNVMTYANSMSSGKAAESGAAPPVEKAGGAKVPAAEARKIIIDSLVIEGGEVNVSQALLKGKVLTAPLPPIRLNNIGRDTGGASASAVVEQIIDAISSEAMKVGNSALMKELGALKQEGIDAAKGAAQKALQRTVGNDVGGAVQNNLGNVGGALKGFLGK
jgi:hypothetical protein